MDDTKPTTVKIYRSGVLIYTGNDIDMWNKLLQPDD